MKAIYLKLNNSTALFMIKSVGCNILSIGVMPLDKLSWKAR